MHEHIKKKNIFSVGALKDVELYSVSALQFLNEAFWREANPVLERVIYSVLGRHSCPQVHVRAAIHTGEEVVVNSPYVQ